MKQLNWTRIQTAEDIAHLMAKFGYFHDACIKEIHYESGMSVDDKLFMDPLNSKRNVSVIFQRQFRNPSAMEMRFERIEQLVLRPVDETYTGEIYEADMIIENGNIIWADRRLENGLQSLMEPRISWIKAESVCWRPLENCMGESAFFQPRQDD